MKALVAVEVQLRSDPLFLFAHSKADRVQHKVNRLFCASLISDNAVIYRIDPGSLTDTEYLDRYRIPCFVCIYEMSVTHFLLGLSA